MFNPYVVLGYGSIMLLVSIVFVWWTEQTSRPRRRATTHRR